jgi:hypothetical protein
LSCYLESFQIITFYRDGRILTPDQEKHNKFGEDTFGEDNMSEQSSDMEKPKPKLLDQVRNAARRRHLSHKTEDAYVNFIKRYILFHNNRHPEEMGKEEIEAFLTHLAVDKNVSASTQNQAFSAILFLYRKVLEAVH